MKTKKTRTNRIPTALRETPELAQLLDIAVRVTGKNRSEIIRECVASELPKYVQRETPEVLRRAEQTAAEIRGLLEDFERLSASQGKK